ncbi:hypothetical protein DXG03_000642 [Asterophora parasitica]|uniref:LIM-domain binding protein-domain-containing protein n=1 Tax=Asterophora parasitica TaxID=117018 RepID=A0A9P7KBZ1_9AGAR|nr:hypothetical protein DXG03_000642 [Asterophora parasitica]
MNGNVHPDMLRQGLPPTAMLSMNPPFMQQPGPAATNAMQQQLNVAINPGPMGMSMTPTQQQQRYLQMQAGAEQQQRAMQQMQMQLAQNRAAQGQPMMGPSPPGASSVPGGGVGVQPHMGMPFNPAMLPQGSVNVGVRRVASQPQISSNNMGGMVGMSPQGAMRGMPMQQGMQHQLRMSGQGQLHMQSDVPMAMNRQGGGGNPGIPMQIPGRTGSAQAQAQLMNSLSQPPSRQQHPLAPQQHQQRHPQHQQQHQNQPFQAPVQIPSQHPHPGQIPSPRPPQSHTPSQNQPGPSSTPVGRPQMNPDDPMSFMNFSGAQFPTTTQQQQQHTPRMPQTPTGGGGGGNPFPFVASSTPPNSMPDMGVGAQPMSGTPGMGGTTSRTGFQLTPAQQFEQMTTSTSASGSTPGSSSVSAVDNNNFALSTLSNTSSPHFGMMMPPPNHVPPRPPSQQLHGHGPHTPLSQQPQQPQQQQGQGQGQMAHQQHSPHPSDAHNMTPIPTPHMHPMHPPHSSHPPHPSHPTHQSHPMRPQSQPQAAIPRPPSQQTGAQPQHTPRSTHPQPSGVPPPAPPTGRMQPSMQIAPTHLSIAPRPPQGSQGPIPMPPTRPQLQGAQSGDGPQGASTGASIPMPVPRGPPVPQLQVGQGQGLIRLLQFSGVLAAENKTNKLQLAWWHDLIQEYFTPQAQLKFTLWKDNQRNEAKPFEIGVPILPRFFLVTTQSGVKSMTLSLDGARERIYGHGHSIVECVTAIWTYKYTNGYTVTLRGPLTVHVIVNQGPSSSDPSAPGARQGGANAGMALKFEDFQFDANYHDKYIALDSITGPRSMGSPKTPRVRNAGALMMNGAAATTQQQRQEQLEEDKKWEEPRVTIEMATIPGEPVNAFGIPQATMRCLELAESVSAMADLIGFSNDRQLGPLEALSKFAARIKETQSYNPPPPNFNNANPQLNTNTPPNSNSFPSMHSNPNNVPSTPAVTLYSSAPASVTNPSTNPPPPHPAPTPTGTTASPQNPLPASANNSPQKQHKTIPGPPQSGGTSSSSSAPAGSPAVSSGATNNTPALANASLKRKQGAEAASPTSANPEPPNKRATRRRKPNAAGGGG